MTMRWKSYAATAAVAFGLAGWSVAQPQQPQPQHAQHGRSDAAQAAPGSAMRSGDFAMAKRWQKATDLMGKKVTNSANEDLGRIEDIVVDASSGRILYGVLSFGGFLGLGDKLFAVPWPSLQLSGDAKAFVLNVDKDRLKTAQGFDKTQWPNFADETWSTTTYKYYNQSPYWLSANDPPTRVPDASDRLAAEQRQRWYQKPVSWQKSSDLCGKEARTMATDDVGKITDLAIDPDCGRIMYGILSYRGKMFAIPWTAVGLNADAKHFVLNVDKEKLNERVAFTKDNWPNLCDPAWAAQTHTYYSVQPYWIELSASDGRTANR